MLSVVQDIFRQHFTAYAAGHAQPLHVHKAAGAIKTCRTAQRGYHLQGCPDGHVVRRINNSCKHRSCALCAFTTVERWLRRQMAHLIRCDYYHVIFTIPHQLIILWEFNRRVFTNLLFSASWHYLRELLADERHLGALPGAIGSLHTWNQRLGKHLHTHFLVTAGGTDSGSVFRNRFFCPFRC